MKAIGGTSSFGVVAFTGTATTPSPMRNITGNYSTLKTAVESLNIQTAGMPSVVSGTDIAAGIE